MGVVGEGVRVVVTVDDHTHLMGWDITEMGTKQNIMTKTKNHTHCVCMILHTDKVRGGDVFVNGRCTSGVFYVEVKKQSYYYIRS